MELVEVSAVLAVVRRQERLAHFLGDVVDARVLARGADIQPHVRLPRRGNPHRSEHQHRQVVVQHRCVVPRVVQDDGLEAEQILAVDVAIEVDAEAWLAIAARRVAADADARVADLGPLPLEVDRIVGVVEVMRVQVRPILRVDVQPDVVERAAVDERVRRRLRAETPERARHECHGDDEEPERRSCHCTRSQIAAAACGSRSVAGRWGRRCLSPAPHE